MVIFEKYKRSTASMFIFAFWAWKQNNNINLLLLTGNQFEGIVNLIKENMSQLFGDSYLYLIPQEDHSYCHLLAHPGYFSLFVRNSPCKDFKKKKNGLDSKHMSTT